MGYSRTFIVISSVIQLFFIHPVYDDPIFVNLIPDFFKSVFLIPVSFHPLRPSNATEVVDYLIVV